MADRVEGDLAEGDLARLRVEEKPGGGERIAGHFQVLRDDVAGAEREDAESGVRTGDSLHDLEDGAVAAADEEGVKAGGHGVTRLLAGGVRGERFLQMNVAAVAAEELGDLLDLGAALLIVDEQRVEEHHDAAHQAGFRAGRRGWGRPENSI